MAAPRTLAIYPSETAEKQPTHVMKNNQAETTEPCFLASTVDYIIVIAGDIQPSERMYLIAKAIKEM